ncbi:MAG: hypothetical protein HKN16_07290, partial [Saprospiraceae bacterium]|nr:hypothetical protein [Saprospiraceae bacterium]
MIDQLRKNILFYSLTFIFLLIGLGLLAMIESGDALLYLGHDRSDFAQSFFRIMTRFGEELTYIVILLAFLFVEYRYAVFVPIIGIIVSLVALG